MSLIHNMLKDLEKRQLPARHALPASHNKVRIKQIKSKNKIILWLLFTLSVLMLTLLLNRHDKKFDPMQTMLHDEIAITTLAPTPESTWTKPVSIDGITLQMKEGTTELTFLMDHAALYHLHSNGMLNQLIISIDKADLRAELPPVNYLHTAISQLQASNNNGRIDFIVNLSPETSLQHININETGKNAELTITFANTPNNVDKSNPLLQTNNVKSQALQTILSQQYQNALKIAEAGQSIAAIDQLSALLKANPDYHEIRVSLAALLLETGKLSQAELVVDQGLQLNPSDQSLVELKARILSTQGNPQQALTVLQQSIPALEENPDYHALLAAMYEQTNEHTLAADLYKQLVTFNPHNGNWWFGLGLAMDKLGQGKQAEEAYTRAITEGKLQASSIVYVQNRMHQLREANNDKD